MSFDGLERGEIERLADWLLETNSVTRLSDDPAFEAANYDALVAVIGNPEHRRLTERWIDIARQAGFCPRCDGVDDGDFAVGRECQICGRNPRPSAAQIAEANADADYERKRDERDEAEMQR